ncbi:hypothetical protein [Chimaeribacter californicus]|uniref:hypothetical protein n=1 Tax=Chimaeribacter californicus TaxID=2060067 RepID=UPI0011AF7CC2|nr:hypothetical protein [Chimaeribacter californicus]
MKKIALFSCFAIFVFLLVSYGRPFVIIDNETDNVIYLYSGTGENGVEPNEEEASDSMNPVRIEKGKSAKVPLTFYDIAMKDRKLYLGWKIGNIISSQATAVRYKEFDITSEEGSCAVKISIKEGKDLVRSISGNFCFKKLNLTLKNKR